MSSRKQEQQDKQQQDKQQERVECGGCGQLIATIGATRRPVVGSDVESINMGMGSWVLSCSVCPTWTAWAQLTTPQAAQLAARSKAYHLTHQSQLMV